MLLNRKTKGDLATVSVGVLLGVGICLILTLIGVAIISWLIHSESMQDNAIGYGVMIILFFSALVGAWVASVKVRRLYAQVSLITGSAYYIVLLAVTAVFFGGKYQGMGVTAVMIILGCVAASLIGLRAQKGKKVRFKKSAYC